MIRPARSIKKRLLKSISAIAALILLGIALIAAVGLHDLLGKADIALVLGTKVETDGKPSERLRARLDRTIELYRAGYFPRIIVSGGAGKEGYDEAVVMKQYLMVHQIPDNCIVTDNEGVNTYASAANTLRIMQREKYTSVLVISQYFHIPRSRLALKRFGITTVFSAHAHYFSLRDCYSLPRELFGYVEYCFRRFDVSSTDS